MHLVLRRSSRAVAIVQAVLARQPRAQPQIFWKQNVFGGSNPGWNKKNGGRKTWLGCFDFGAQEGALIYLDKWVRLD